MSNKEMMDAVIIELDYKASYSRYALTPDEFCSEFEDRLKDDMPKPEEEGTSYTLRPMVHIWYKKTKVGSNEWNNFFANMAWGLPESDVEGGNLAYIAEEEFISLKDSLPKILYEFYCTTGGNLHMYSSYLLVVENETEKTYSGRVLDCDIKYENCDRFRAKKETMGKVVLINGRNSQYYKLQLEAESYEKAYGTAMKLFL